MLKFVCLIVFTIGNVTSWPVNPDYYVPLIADIQNYYKASGISILYDDNAEKEFETQIIIANFIKRFSSLFISSQALHYSKLKDKSDYYVSVNVQTLFTVFLTTERNVEHFGLATSSPDMSYHTWLVLFANDNANNSKFCYAPQGNPFHLVFNTRMIVRCYGDDRIYKWYSVYKNRTETLEMAKWTSNQSIVSENRNYYESRFDLSGKVIRIATPTNLTTDASARMYGFFNDLLTELQSFMHFRIKKVYETDTFGLWDESNSTWTGLVGLLATGKVDLVVAPVTISKHRMDSIDFSKPLLLTANRIYLKQPLGARVPWSAYFQAFAISSWLSLASMFVLASFLTAYMRSKIDKSKRKKVAKRPSLNYLTNFIRIWGIYCQQGLPELPSATPLRMAYVTKMLLMLVIWNVYSASITSYLTVLTPTLPFSDIQGFINDGSYKLTVVQNSSDLGAILKGEDPILLSLQPLLEDIDSLPYEAYSAFLQVCNEKVGFYSSDAVFRGLSVKLPCEVTYIETGQYECLALGLAKRSPYMTSINYNIRRLEDNGLLKRLLNWYFRRTENISPAIHTQIGFWSIVPLLSVIGVGFAASIAIFSIENLYRLCKRDR